MEIHANFLFLTLKSNCLSIQSFKAEENKNKALDKKKQQMTDFVPMVIKERRWLNNEP